MSKKFNIAKSADCICCTEYKIGEGCKWGYCQFMVARAKMGGVSYRGIVSDCFADVMESELKGRFDNLIKSYNGQMFLNKEHEDIFNSVLQDITKVCGNPSSKQVGAIFILTSSKSLWNKVKNGVHPSGFDFGKMHIDDFDLEDYQYYLSTKALYTNHVDVEEVGGLFDSQMTDDSFMVMVHGKMIKLYGLEILKVQLMKWQ